MLHSTHPMTLRYRSLRRGGAFPAGTFTLSMALPTHGTDGLAMSYRLCQWSGKQQSHARAVCGEDTAGAEQWSRVEQSDVWVAPLRLRSGASSTSTRTKCHGERHGQRGNPLMFMLSCALTQAMLGQGRSDGQIVAEALSLRSHSPLVHTWKVDEWKRGQVAHSDDAEQLPQTG
eukprot:scaffold70110_cov31-Tisochrysis_lutea.AAC.1